MMDKNVRDILDYLSPDEWEMFDNGPWGHKMWLTQVPEYRDLATLLVRIRHTQPDRPDLLALALDLMGQWFIVYSTLGDGITAYQQMADEDSARRTFTWRLEEALETAHV